MTEIHLTLNNFNGFETLLQLFPASNIYEFTPKKVFRRKEIVVCKCGCRMRHNGHNFVRKKGFGIVKIGKQECPICKSQFHENKIFWKDLLSQWKEAITSFIMVLRDSHVGWQTISKLLDFIIPCSKDKARYLFNSIVEQFEYPQDNCVIVCYDEQHPKKGRTQKYRLTLLNYQTKIPIADKLFDNKEDETIKKFLREHLDTSKKLVVITDCDRRYPEIFKRIGGKKVIQQKCLMHLNKLVVKDFGKITSLLDEFHKYMILDIFYNRKKELKYLERLIKKQDKKAFSDVKEKRIWVKNALNKFREYLKELENTRRRNGKNLTQRRLFMAKKNLDNLLSQNSLFPKDAQKRLKMIKENWNFFTAFYHIKGCPATNNRIENFYSTSMKTHRKKQLRSDAGILNHMKLAAIKRAGKLFQPKKTLLEIYGLIRLIVSS